MEISRVSRKGLTTIPAKIRKALGIEEGDILLWGVDSERKVAVVRVAKDPLRLLKGKYNDPDLDYEKVEEQADKIVSDLAGK